ncbi:hypothetical protein [Acidovorax sp. NO-1]|uniref:hypothetical protein n=1 Tax=Acidovorax sp. NO-1 TaxID=512030 RepID=UPI0003066B2B|nr:hypothetical protein [Acidovorax sp. NO-1]
MGAVTASLKMQATQVKRTGPAAMLSAPDDSREIAAGRASAGCKLQVFLGSSAYQSSASSYVF